MILPSYHDDLLLVTLLYVYVPYYLHPGDVLVFVPSCPSPSLPILLVPASILGYFPTRMSYLSLGHVSHPLPPTLSSSHIGCRMVRSIMYFMRAQVSTVSSHLCCSCL